MGGWIRRLCPNEGGVLARSVLPAATVEELTVRLGAGPAGWAVELGRAIADRIVVEVPELGVHGIVEMVRVGGEAVALHATAALADEKDFRVDAAPEALLGPAEVVSRGVGVEHMLRSIRVGHGLAVQRVLDAAEELIPADDRFAQMRRINEVLFDIADRLSEAMAREYGRAHDVWLASSAALRREVLQEILRGGRVPLDRAVRTLGYDLSRHHLALVVWTDEYTMIGAHRLEEAAAAVLAACECTSTLIVPVGGRRVWAWGAHVGGPPSRARVSAPRPPADVRVAMGVPASGVEGFVASHRQALEAERVATISVAARWVFDYRELDVVAMLSSDMEQAREFVRRELGSLADPREPVTAVRATLKCYLDVGRSLTEAATLLHVARNTVAYRVQRAEQLRGRKISERRLPLQAALALADEFGTAVLGDTPATDRPPSTGT
ncbi:PucR family transcriptional regulator [Nocardia vaccinii]|uniref:PucR family transcriptional regulator n=1 Tax=Nocardia vaccinii TaxID=1822 RepID=UPI000831F37B|nr:helix-turn-helix domain-containing protein [Nocardia vaccinii]